MDITSKSSIKFSYPLKKAATTGLSCLVKSFDIFHIIKGSLRTSPNCSAFFYRIQKPKTPAPETSLYDQFQ